MPNLAPISENGRRTFFRVSIHSIAISSVCSFCGRVAAGVRPLDCRSHFICDSCSQQRRIMSVCPLCANLRQTLSYECWSFVNTSLLAEQQACHDGTTASYVATSGVSCRAIFFVIPLSFSPSCSDSLLCSRTTQFWCS